MIKIKSTAAKCISITGWGILTLILTVAVLLTTVAFTINFSMLGADISSQMVVLTGHRTRDWSSANSYSMHSAVEDRYSRLYVCMMSADILVPGNPTYSSLVDFRDKAKHHHDCGTESDGGWPRDYGFLRCAQANFNVTFHQSNVFLKCLDLSEGIMVETIQTPASTLFLGSYNFVTMLLASMGVMTAFLLFTAGGVCIEDGLKTPMKHVFIEGSDEEPKFIPSGYTYVAASQGWAPLAAVPVTLALLWSLFMFGTSIFYTFPPKDMWSDIVAVDGGSRALPGTPWTGFMCSGVSLVMAVYFASCLVEWYGDRSDRKFHTDKDRFEQNKIDNDRLADERNAAQEAADAAEESKKNQAVGTMQNALRNAAAKRAVAAAREARRAAAPQVMPPPTQSTPPPSRQPPMPPMPPLQRSQSARSAAPGQPRTLLPQRFQAWGGPGAATFSEQSPTFPPGYPPASNIVPANWATGPSRGYSVPANGGPPIEFVADMYSAPKTQRRPTHLGIRYNPQLHYDDHATTHLAPLLNKAFALTWVFADGLLFLGMLNGQNSLLNENVVAIWYYIIQCRGFQLAAAYFMDDVVFADKEGFAEMVDSSKNKMDVWMKRTKKITSQFGLGWGDETFGVGKFKTVQEVDESDPMGHINDFANTLKAEASQSKIIHAGIATACSQLASLWCMVIVLFHFINALSIPLELNANGVSNPTHAVQLAFIVIMVCMEIGRHTIAFMAIYGHFGQKTYLNIIQATFFMDWLIRAVFIVSTLFTVPFDLGDRNMKLFTYLL